MKHDVHVFAIVRVKIENVEAESQTEAIDKAEKAVDFHRLLHQSDRSLAAYSRDWYGTSGIAVTCVEFAEECSHYLVDEAGDEEYARSKWYQSDGRTEGINA